MQTVDIFEGTGCESHLSPQSIIKAIDKWFTNRAIFQPVANKIRSGFRLMTRLTGFRYDSTCCRPLYKAHLHTKEGSWRAQRPKRTKASRVWRNRGHFKRHLCFQGAFSLQKAPCGFLHEARGVKPPSSTCVNTNSAVMSVALQKDRLSRRSCCFSGKFLISQERQTSRAELIEDDPSWRAPLANFPHYPKSSGAARRTTYILITRWESRFFFFLPLLF